MLVSYDITNPLWVLMHDYEREYEDAAQEVICVITEFVEPDHWMDNGGELAHMSVVAGKLFIKAPARFHTQIRWVLDQLPSESREELATANPRGLPGSEDPALVSLRRAADDAKNEHNIIRERFLPGTIQYESSRRNYEHAQDLYEQVRKQFGIPQAGFGSGSSENGR